MKYMENKQVAMVLMVTLVFVKVMFFTWLIKLKIVSIKSLLLIGLLCKLAFIGIACVLLTEKRQRISCAWSSCH